MIFWSFFFTAELYHQQRQQSGPLPPQQSFYTHQPHPGAGMSHGSVSHGSVIRAHCSTFVGGSNSEIMALNASMLSAAAASSAASNGGPHNSNPDFISTPHPSILRSSVDNLLQQHPMVRIRIFVQQILCEKCDILVSSSCEMLWTIFLGKRCTFLFRISNVFTDF